MFNLIAARLRRIEANNVIVRPEKQDNNAQMHPINANEFIAPPCDEHIQILHEDEHLLVIDKPSGLLSLSGKNPANKDSVHYRLVQDYPTATMLHRLDFGTSGAMVVALNKQVNAHLTKQFQARTITKHYHAILLGHLTNDEGIIDAPIAKAEFPYQQICHETGKPAQSHYQVLERRQGLLSGTEFTENHAKPHGGAVDASLRKTIKTTKVLFTPKTGRTHQLRVHSQGIGHPIIGCDLYRLTKDGVDSQQLAKRLMLHASRLSFEHPVTGKQLCIESLSNDFIAT